MSVLTIWGEGVVVIMISKKKKLADSFTQRKKLNNED